MESDKIKWDKKFLNRDGELSQPDLFITQNVDLFKNKTILDIASGDGRNSVYLASQGYAVTAVDISEEGLNRLQSFAKKKQFDIKTHQVDLDQPNKLKDLGQFDNLVMVMFKPPPNLWNVLPDLLIEGGIFMLKVFDIRQHEQHGFSREFCAEDGEYLDIEPSFEVLKYEKEEGKYLSRYIFLKK